MILDPCQVQDIDIAASDRTMKRSASSNGRVDVPMYFPRGRVFSTRVWRSYPFLIGDFGRRLCAIGGQSQVRSMGPTCKVGID
jgi:hypothetical protein